MNIFSKPIVAALALTVCHAGFASLIVGEEPGGKGKFKSDSNFEWSKGQGSKGANEWSWQKRSIYFEPNFKRAVKSLGDYKPLSSNGKKVIDKQLVRVKKTKVSNRDKGNWGGKKSWDNKIIPLDYKCPNGRKCDTINVAEPGTVVLLGIGMLGLAMTRRHYLK